MRPVLKICLLTLAGAALVAVGLAAYLVHRALDPETLRREASRILTEKTGGTVELGPPELAMFPKPGLTLGPSTLELPDGTRVGFAHASVAVDLMDVGTRRIVFDEAVLRDLAVTVPFKRADPQTTVQSGQAPPVVSKSPQAQAVEIVPPTFRVEGFSLTVLGASGAPVYTASVERLLAAPEPPQRARLTLEGAARLSGPGFDLPLRFDAASTIALDAQARSAGAALALALGPEFTARIALEFDLVAAPNGPNIAVRQCRLTDGPLRFALNGTLDAVQARLDFSGEGIDPAHLAHLARPASQATAALPDLPVERIDALRGRFHRSERTLAVHDLSLKWGDLSLAGRLRVPDLDAPSLEFSLHLPKLDLNRLPLKGKKVAQSTEPTPEPTPVATSRQPSPSLSASPFTGDVPALQVRPAAASPAKSPFTASGDLTIDRLLAGPIELGGVNTALRFVSGAAPTLALDRLGAALYGGTLSGRTTFAFSTPVKGDFDLAAAGVDVERLLVALNKKSPLTGTLSGDFRGKLPLPGPLPVAEWGSGKVVVKNGRILEHSALREFLVVVGEAVAGVVPDDALKARFRGLGKSDRFKEVRSSVRVSGKTLHLPDFLYTAEESKAYFAGRVDLAAKRIDGHAALEPTIIAGLRIPATVSGPLDSPTFAPDLAGVLASLARSPKAVGDFLKGLGVDGLIRDLLPKSGPSRSR